MANDSNINHNDGLETYVKEYKIFVDTCSILYEYGDAGDAFWIRLTELLKANHRFIFVPARVIKELEGCATNENFSEEQRSFISDRLNMIKEMKTKGLVKSYGTKDENFANADNVFQTAFTRYRPKCKLLLITQDNNLAQTILRLNDDLSTADCVEKVEAKRIGNNGELWFYGWQRPKVDFDDDDGVEPFRLFTSVTKIPNTPLPCTQVVEEGARLYTSQAQVIELGKKIASGGEGIIYETNTEYVAKIYKPDQLTRHRYEKLNIMLNHPVKKEWICWPVTMLYNLNNEFVGFLMPAAKGITIQDGIFFTGPFKKLFPDWKKRDLVELCVTILKKIVYLHRRNIIMGDLNPNNILVVSPTEVYFVDVDSWQMEDFPCHVGTINYTAPEIQGKKYETFLRTLGNENFAVATLLFMLMLPGKPPYAQQGGEDPVTNITNMDFSYPLGGESNDKTPEGPWRFMWSHLTYKIKEKFYKTFRKGEEFSTEDTRLNAQKWFGLFCGYLKLLDNGTMAKQDKMSEEIFPTRFKMNDKIKYVACLSCGEPIPEESKRKVCRKCGDNVVEEYTCAGCGKEMCYTYHEKYNMQLVCGYSYCSECRSKVVHRGSCVQCGKSFEITGGEFDYFKTQGWELPKKCPECRERDKQLVQCKLCKRNVPFGKTTEGYCNECLEKDVVPPFECPGCHKTTIRYTNYHKYVKKLNAPYRLCKECHEREAKARTQTAQQRCSDHVNVSKSTPSSKVPKESETKTLFQKLFGSFFK